jgi:hypothetical protein
MENQTNENHEFPIHQIHFLLAQNNFETNGTQSDLALVASVGNAHDFKNGRELRSLERWLRIAAQVTLVYFRS